MKNYACLYLISLKAVFLLLKDISFSEETPFCEKPG